MCLVIRFLVFVVTPLALSACMADGAGAPAVQSGLSFELSAAAGSADEVNESRFAEYAYSFLEKNRSKYALENPREQLMLKKEDVDELNYKHLRFQQVHKSVPVWGREIIVHLDESDSVYSVSGKILTGLGTLDARPRITKKKITDLVMQNKQWGGEGWQTKGIDLYVLNKNGNNYLVYRLTLTKGLLREFVFMSAHDAEIIHGISGTYTTN